VHFQYADVGGQLGQYQALSSGAGLSSMRKGHTCHTGKQQSELSAMIDTDLDICSFPLISQGGLIGIFVTAQCTLMVEGR